MNCYFIRHMHPCGIFTLLRITFLLTIIFLGPNCASARKFEGVVEYDIKFELGNNDVPKMLQRFLPQEMKVYVKGSMVRLETSGVFPLVFQINQHKEEASLLLDVFGEKSGTKKSFSTISEKGKTQVDQIQFVKTKQKTRVAGYRCSEYVFEKDLSNVSILAYPKINILTGEKHKEQFASFDFGIPLQIVVRTKQGHTMKIVCSNIDRKKLKDKQFLVPEEHNIGEGLNWKSIQPLLGKFKSEQAKNNNL